MNAHYLYEDFEGSIARPQIQMIPVPATISNNLNSKYPIRPYQAEAFRRFVYYINESARLKTMHLLFNMATGSGKTLIMAGLILHLYEKGYRNFLFFVHSDTIIKKTRENFLNNLSSKYLFNDEIIINSKKILIKESVNYSDAESADINIKFTTIQKLHSDLTTPRENRLTISDLKENKLVLIGDEAHHYNSSTKRDAEDQTTWENTALSILDQRSDNILLEFTATIDYEDSLVKQKYLRKIIFRYDLKEFRLDRYSKEINILRSMYPERERILQALIMNLYRSELAGFHRINLKPVIFFKAKQTIEESKRNKENFHALIDGLTMDMVLNIQKTSTIPVIAKAFNFFRNQNIGANEIVRRLKIFFRFENCLSANDDSEKNKNQILLNSLEDEDNPIRAIFAVQKLNEGWDVLNLFDIVRLYEGRNSGGSNATVGKTTISEAQLIGRGARYFPFASEQGENRFMRKFDQREDDDLRILEELYYHARDESKYISELKAALRMSGMMDDESSYIKKQLSLKLDFKETDFYQTGKVFYNKKIKRDNSVNCSIADLGVTKHNFEFFLTSGEGRIDTAFDDNIHKKAFQSYSRNFKLSEIPEHIIRFALSKNPYYRFESLLTIWPGLSSTTEFIKSKTFLGNLEIKLTGLKAQLENVSPNTYLSATEELLRQLESEIKNNVTEFEGSEYEHDLVSNVFVDKEIKISKDKDDNHECDFVMEEDWYAYSSFYGTSEESDFLKLFKARFENINAKFEKIYLIRNEREVKIVDKKGNAFEPDFVLFCQKKDEPSLSYQVFIEPKGSHLIAFDSWKNDLLRNMNIFPKVIEIYSDKYSITAVPFYNSAGENEFKRAFDETLSI